MRVLIRVEELHSEGIDPQLLQRLTFLGLLFRNPQLALARCLVCSCIGSLSEDACGGVAFCFLFFQGWQMDLVSRVLLRCCYRCEALMHWGWGFGRLLY